jgi:hypothetical protein
MMTAELRNPYNGEAVDSMQVTFSAGHRVGRVGQQ